MGTTLHARGDQIMGLKIFGKVSQFEVKTGEPEEATRQRVEKLESQLAELGSEVIKLRQEVNTLLTRQQTFKSALRRLREFLELRGAQRDGDSVHEEVAANFQDISSDYETEERPTLEVAEVNSRVKFKSSLH